MAVVVHMHFFVFYLVWAGGFFSSSSRVKRCRRRWSEKGKPIEGISQTVSHSNVILFFFSCTYLRTYVDASSILRGDCIWWRLNHLASCWQHQDIKRRKVSERTRKSCMEMLARLSLSLPHHMQKAQPTRERRQVGNQSVVHNNIVAKRSPLMLSS
jgi:hypothetical protein